MQQAERYDVVIVGGGIAGLEAAHELVKAGVRVALLEERPVLGGRFACRTEWVLSPSGLMRLHEWVQRMISEVMSCKCEVFVNTPAIEAAPGRVVVITGDVVCEIETSAVIVASGARAQPLPFAGWARPGVMTGDAVRTLIHRDGVLPGKHVVVAGLTDEALWTARELLFAGAEHVTLVAADHPVESVPGGNQILNGYVMRSVSDEAATSANARVLSPWVLKSLAEMPESLFIRPDWVIGAAHGRPMVTEVELIHRTTGTRESLPCDLVVLCHMHSPVLELLQLAGGRFVYELALGGWTPVYGWDLQSTVPGLWVAGGSAGADTPLAEFYTGCIAGKSVAVTLGAITSTYVARDWEAVANASTAARREARERIWKAFSSNEGMSGNAWSRDGWSGTGRAHIHRSSVRRVEDWTVLCRCEDINVEDIRVCIDQGARTPDDVKRMTRCGMGLCQWRECRTLVLEQMSEMLNVPIDGLPLPNVRFPLRPVSLGALMEPDTADGAVRSVLSEVDEHE